LKSVFVFSRLLEDGRTVVAVGEGTVPAGARTIGTFGTLQDAIRFRDRKRLEVAFGLVDDPYPQRRVKRAATGR